MNRTFRGLAVMSLLALGGACSSSDPAGPGSIQNNLVFTRADQSSLGFSGAAVLYVWCGEWEEGAIPAQTLHILFGGPGSDDPRWQLRAVVANVTIGVPSTFPNTFVFDDPRNVDLYVADFDDNPKNELSTQDNRSSGSITFQELQCISGGSVQFSIDAIVGSEFGSGPSMSVRGTFQAMVGPPPT